jgi:hypothetical protein
MLVTDIGYALAGLTAVGIIFIGARFSLRPARLPQASGLPPGTMAGRPILTCRSRASATSPRD